MFGTSSLAERHNGTHLRLRRLPNERQWFREREWGMYEHFPRYPWVLPVVRYETVNELLTNLAERVIGPAEQRLAAAKASV